MSLSHYAFRLLPLKQQLPLVWTEGTYLARRFEGEDTVALYHLPGGFFCEVYVALESNALLRTRTFTSTAGLDAYACYVRLDDLSEPTS